MEILQSPKYHKVPRLGVTVTAYDGINRYNQLFDQIQKEWQLPRGKCFEVKAEGLLSK
jgi:hypothetical protein